MDFGYRYCDMENDSLREQVKRLKIEKRELKKELVDKACRVARDMGFDGVADQIRKAMED